jgi:aminopeptidase N
VLGSGLEAKRPSAHFNRFVARARVRDFAFAIGKFVERSRVVDGVRVRVAGAQTELHSLPTALRRAAHAFGSLQNWYGGYALPQLNVIVGNLSFGGAEYPGIVFSTPDTATVAHEVAHQWFYGLVGNDQYADPWLDESLTAFTEQRFHHEYRCDIADPLDSSAHGLSTGMNYWGKHPSAYVNTIYRGGACALTRLRHDIGAVAFDAAMRGYVQANKGKIASTDDFLAAVRDAAPSYDLAAWEHLVGLN